MEETAEKIILNKKFGDEMALVKYRNGAVLVLTKRQETDGPFLDFDAHKYPIIKFERPPELCGINEPKDKTELANLQKKLFKELIESIIMCCKKQNLKVVYCAGTENKISKKYSDELLGLGAVLKVINNSIKLKI